VIIMGFEKWKTIVKKADVEDEEWDELVVVSSTTALGPTILADYLQTDGDVIEIDMTDKDRRAIGNFLRALRVAATRQKQKLDFLLRYNKERTKAYIKRVG